MNGWFWYLFVMHLLGIVVTVATIGRRREPMTPGAGAIVVLWSLFNMFALYMAVS